VSFAGLPFLAVAGAGLATLLAVIGLYLLRPTPREHVVSSVQFWVRAAQKARARLLFSRRIPILAFLLTLIIAMLLVFELGDPRFGAAFRGTTVVVYAADRTMEIQGEGSGARIAAARRVLKELVQQGTVDGRVAVVRAGIRPSVLVGLSEHPGDLDRALEHEEAIDEGAADLDAAVALADRIVRHAGDAEGRIVVIADRMPRATGLATPVYLVPVGEAGETVAITALGARRDPGAMGEYAVYAEVTAFTSRPARARLVVRDRDVVISEENLRLAPGQRVVHHANGFSSQRAEITAKLENVRIEGGADDAQALDDAAYGVVEPLARTKVLLVTRGNRFLEGALTVNPAVRLTRHDPAWMQQRASAGTIEHDLAAYDVVVLDRWAPATALRHPGVLMVAPPSGAGGVRITQQLTNPRATAWLSGHPTLDKVRLDQVVIRQSSALLTEAEDSVLIRSDRYALAIARERQGRRQIVLGFDTQSTGLVQRIAFPIFMHNTLVWLAHEGGGYRSYQRPGDALHVGAGAAAVLLPQGDAREAHGGTFFETGRAGLYHMGERAVAVSGADSAAAIATPPARQTEDEPGSKIPPLGVLIATVLLAVMLLEWTLFHRGKLS